MSSIPSETALSESLYGSAYVDVKNAFDDIAKIRSALKTQRDSVLAEIDMKLIEDVSERFPKALYEDGKILREIGFPDGTVETVLRMQYVIKRNKALELAGDIMDGIDRQGLAVGMAEHSVRAGYSGELDRNHKAAIARKREAER